MLRNIQIKNFKTLKDSKINLGRLNIVVGENGSGKSNLLEAIALGVSGVRNKLDNEHLSLRGIRLANPPMMKSCFTKESSREAIEVIFSEDVIGQTFHAVLQNENTPYSSWVNLSLQEQEKMMASVFEYIFAPPSKGDEILKLAGLTESPDFIEQIKSFKIKISDSVGDALPELSKKDFISNFSKNLLSNFNKDISDFVIYRPEETMLRRFDKQGQLEPLGSKGEGLLKLLTVFNTERPAALLEIKECLKLFDWFEDMKFKDQLFEKEFFFDIKDKYFDDSLGYFDQRSTNEGFLYLVFYLSLFISNKAPKTFAIDNIDNSLNPKLGIELIKILNDLSIKYNKQAILTTHNPAILDGLNLNDQEQKLFILSRKRDGSTRIVDFKTKPEGSKFPMKLSEMFMAGMIGGLPKNF